MFSNCSFRDNAADSYGAAIYAAFAASVTLQNSEIKDNTAGTSVVTSTSFGGGGFFNNVGSINITNCTVSYKAAAYCYC